MKRSDMTGERIFALFLLGTIAFNAPILTIFSTDTVVFGIPLLFVYLFAAWSVLIALMALTTTRWPRDSVLTPPPPHGAMADDEEEA